MIHYSCDRCKRLIDPEVDLRYVVRLEVQAIMETLDVDDLDDERDHLLEIQEMLEQLEEGEGEQQGQLECRGPKREGSKLRITPS